MILFKLAIKNLRNRFNYYLMYILSMMFSAMVYYSFVSMSFDTKLLATASNDIRIDTGLRAGSIMIILFIIVFMFSANSFFIRGRKREIGLYSLLGMRRRQISGLLFVENIILGILALFTGICLGIIFSKLFGMVLFKFMHIKAQSHLIVSFSAIKNTVLIFFIILIIVSIRTSMIVYRFKPITLFKADQESDEPMVITWKNWLFGFLGVLFLILGYYMAANFFTMTKLFNHFSAKNGTFLLVGPITILIFCIIGTYFIFTHFFVIFLKGVSSYKRHYYQDIHMMTIGSLSFNLRKNGRALASISLLSATALAAIGGAASFQSYILRWENYSNPTSYAVADSVYPKLKDFLKEEGTPISNEVKLNFKLSGGEFDDINNFDKLAVNDLYNIISLSNYNKAKTITHRAPSITLANEKDVVILDNVNQFYNQDIIKYSKKGILANVGVVNVVDYKADTLGNQRDMRISANTLVVTDELYKKIDSRYTYSYYLVDVENSDKNEQLAKDTLEAFDDEINTTYGIKARTSNVNGSMVDSIELVKAEDLEIVPNEYHIRSVFSSRYLNYNSLSKSTGLLIYVAVFLGMIFMVATGSIISLKQLSEAEINASNYDLLRKLGTPNHLIKKNVYTQNKIIFFVPLTISVLHAYFAIQVLLAIIGIQNMKLTYISVGFLIFVYMILYFITSSTYYRIIKQ